MLDSIRNAFLCVKNILPGFVGRHSHGMVSESPSGSSKDISNPAAIELYSVQNYQAVIHIDMVGKNMLFF